jgi:hypothetical protein
MAGLKHENTVFLRGLFNDAHSVGWEYHRWNSVVLSPLANYTDRVIAAGQRS